MTARKNKDGIYTVNDTLDVDRWCLEGPISDAIEYLKSIEEKAIAAGKTEESGTLSIDIDLDRDGASVTISYIFERTETDAERQKRKEKEEKVKQSNKESMARKKEEQLAKDLADYERLKKKFG